MRRDGAGRGARERILKTAGALFYREGYRGVGIDRIIAEANVAKASFYRHFPSKEDLMLAWIAEAEGMMPTPDTSCEKPLRDYALRMLEIAGSGTCLGCTFQVAAAEFTDDHNPVLEAARGVKKRVLKQMTELAELQGHDDPISTALSTYLVIEGVWATVRMFGPYTEISAASDALRRLTEVSTWKPSTQV